MYVSDPPRISYFRNLEVQGIVSQKTKKKKVQGIKQGIIINIIFVL